MKLLILLLTTLLLTLHPTSSFAIPQPQPQPQPQPHALASPQDANSVNNSDGKSNADNDNNGNVPAFAEQMKQTHYCDACKKFCAVKVTMDADSAPDGSDTEAMCVLCTKLC